MRISNHKLIIYLLTNSNYRLRFVRESMNPVEDNADVD